MTDANILDSARALFATYEDATSLLSDPKAVATRSGPTIYICDVGSGRTLMLETRPGALMNLSDQADLDESMFNQIRAALPLLIGDLLNSINDTPPIIHPDTRRGVILGAAFCITETRAFQITKHHGSDVQYVLLRYPNAADKTHVVTPMPVFKPHPIAAKELDATVTHVLMSEQLNFPERFGKESLLQFKETRRHVLAASR